MVENMTWETVAEFSQHLPEFHLVDLAAATIGGDDRFYFVY